MRMYVCAVYDAAVSAYLQPLFFRAKSEAIRSFADACQDEKSNFVRHAADYQLFHLGYFDDASGRFEQLDMPDRLIAAMECLRDDNVYPPGRKLPG